MKLLVRAAALAAACLALVVPLAGATRAAVLWNGTRGVSRPIGISYTGDGTGELLRLHWTSFGGATAKATGADRVNDCTPTCAGGKWHTFASHVTLSRPVTCHGLRVYSSLVIANPASAGSSGQFPLRTRCSG